MLDLTHWDFADSFTAREAAILILGCEPTESRVDHNHLDLVFSRIKRHFGHAMDRHIIECLYPPDVRDDVNTKRLLISEFAPRTELASVMMNRLLEAKSQFGSELPFHEWLQDEKQNRFSNQTFARHDLAVWLDAAGLKSGYQFEVDASTLSIEAEVVPDLSVPNEVPLSTKERNNLLTIIAVLCKEAKLDYTSASKTADLIQSIADGMGVSIGKTSIRDHLKKIPDALGTRIK